MSRFFLINCALVCLVATAVSIDEVLLFPNTQKLQPNMLRHIYNDISGELYEVEDLADLSPSMLRSFGMAKVHSTNSIVVNALLASQAMNPHYVPASESIRHMAKTLSEFTEVSFSNMSYVSSDTDWESIGPCQSNERSSNVSTLAQGWTIAVASGIGYEVSFASTFGLSPTFSVDFAASFGLAGKTTCQVDAGHTVQFQMKSEIFTVSGVRKRRVTIKDTKTLWGTSSVLNYDDEWEKVNDYYQINPRKYQTACVTDPKLLKC